MVAFSSFLRWLPFGKVPEIDARKLSALLSGGSPPNILDVRTGAEFKLSRIAGAVHIPITELASRLYALPFDRKSQVVAICMSAHRSIPAVRLLKEHGFKNAYQLKGGMLAWWHASLPVDKG